jgi:sulfur-carrier protein adenylyltransferase/sulfurtransferase
MVERATTTRVKLGRGELRRYSRHLLIPEVGLAGQERLASARALVIGAGGLGSPASMYLAAAGVGRIGVMDDDEVDETNLQRQTIFATGDVGRKKAQVAAERLRGLNPTIAIDPIVARFETNNARELVRLYDVVLDCTDRFSTRYLVNDACWLERKPDVYGSIFRFDGQVSVFGVAGAPCYRCLYPQPPPPGSIPTCAEGGVLGALAGIVGAWQASEALKILLDIGEPLTGRLMLIDSFGARTREVRFDPDPSCILCGAAAVVHEVAAISDEVETSHNSVIEIGASELDDALQNATLLDVREPHEAVLGSLEAAICIPATQLEARMHELDSATCYVVACRIGAKSSWAIERLRDAGFARLVHLRGGLLAYAARHAEFEFF